MSPQMQRKYLEAYNRGQNDAKMDNPYLIRLEQSNLEKQAYCDGFASYVVIHDGWAST